MPSSQMSPSSCNATNGTDNPPVKYQTDQAPNSAAEAGRQGCQSGSTPLTAANLDASQAERKANPSASQQRVVEAARELGFDLHHSALDYGYGSDKSPMERWVKDDDGYYARTVASSYIDKDKGK